MASTDAATTHYPEEFLRRRNLRLPLEQSVSRHLGRPWRIERLQDRTPDASHPAAILSDGLYAAFVKVGDQPFALDQFHQERAGLELLTARSGVLTPRVLDIIEAEGVVVMVQEAVQVVKRDQHHWRDIGRALAQAHQAKSDTCGLPSHCYWGDLRQDNTPIADWPTFYRERRLRPRLQLAISSGHLPPELAREVEHLIDRLPQFCGPAIRPSLLHGDAHINNFISTKEAAVMIDPAVHYGHPELDLAYLDLFHPAPPDILDGYQEIAAIDSGFTERRDLWRVSAWLGIVAVGGPGWLDRLIPAIRRYL